MSEHSIEVEITVGGEELPATVEFDFHGGIKGYVPRGEAFALEPDEPASVTINAITLSDPEDTPLWRKRGPVKLTDGLLFDAMADEWLQEKCLEHMSEDA